MDMIVALKFELVMVSSSFPVFCFKILRLLASALFIYFMNRLSVVFVEAAAVPVHSELNEYLGSVIDEKSSKGRRYADLW